MKNTSTIAISLCVLMSATAFSASAEMLSPEEALARYNTEAPPGRHKAPTKTRLRLTEEISGRPALYLFSTGSDGGFILLSADDTTTPLLGYADSGAMPESATALPPAFKYWLGSLARQVEYNARHNAQPAYQASLGEAIEPLTTTRWNQDLPFNYYCPVAGDKHCYTGCVATALAQIMKYHNYPPKGTGSHSYGWKNPSTEQDTTLYFDFAATTFRWDIMQDKYDRDTPWDDKMAVAELMYACGVAVDMGYGPWSSGAGTNMIAPAMINYFGYDKGIRNYVRDYYGIDEWNQLVYAQLRDYGPVQYSGFGDTDGHSFIIDGYEDSGYFHVNWGWGGMSDGYFLLTALDPLEQGIGGADQAFDFSQDFIGNVSIGGKSDKIYEQILMSNPFGLKQTEAKPGDTLNVWGGSFNYSPAEIHNIMFGAMLIPDVGTDTLHLTGPVYADLGMGDGVRPYEVKLPDAVPAGTYSLVPAFRNSEGVWQKVPVKIGYTNHYDAVSDGSTIKFTKGAEASIKASDVVAPEMIKLNEKFDITATLTNSSSEEFFGSICVALYSELDPETMMVKSDAVPVDILAGKSEAFDYQALFTATAKQVKADVYYLYVCHQQNGELTKISDPVKVDLDDILISAVGNIHSDAGAEYYTLLGAHLNKMPVSPGIYVKVADGHSSRIIVK